MRPIPDITVRDLCRWDRRLGFLPPVGDELARSLDRPVSWAVSVRTTPPLLPPLRGDELVVLPLRVLTEIEASGTAQRETLLAELVQHKVAAILTDPDFTDEPLPLLPVLTLPAPFPHDAEGMLNRLITEQRAELYRLGNELSRRLSQAAMDPRGVEALLGTAAEVTGRAFVLQDRDGDVVAWGGQQLIPPATSAEMAEARQAQGPLVCAAPNGTERLITTLAAGGQTGYLSLVGPAGSLTESDRLVLVQTAGTCSILLGQGRRGPGSGRERLVADLLLGRLASEAAALARAPILGLDPTRPLIVGLLDPAVPLDTARRLVAQAFGPAVGENIAPVPGGLGFLVQGMEPARAAASLRAALRRERLAGVTIALSRPLSGLLHAPEGFRQARFALGLCQTGALRGPVIDTHTVEDLGLFSLLYPLWGTPALAEFREAILGPLEAYDQRRHSDLVETLAMYLSHGGALAEAAEHLGIHRNTLSYRLQRIAELTRRDLGNAQDRLLLQVALAIRQLPPPPDIGG